ncbi:MAG TPA: ABC transporter permease subunit [Phycisphaerae bacterium]|nr:ABC transporter permease subunit [Phycisphaerae bacterium]
MGGGFHLSVFLLGSLAVLFILAPLVGMMLKTSFGELSAAAAEDEVITSIKVTLLAALAAALAGAVVGIPLAYLLARKRFPGRSICLAIVDLPIIIPHSAAGIALLSIIGRHSFIGRLTGGGLVGTTAGIATAMALVSIPFLINSARDAFAAVPVRIERVARTLGASPARVFFTVSLPLAWRGIVSGMILMWARGISEFGAVVIIAYHPMTTPVMVYQRFTDFGLSYARSVAVLLIIICVTIFVILRLISRPKRTEDRRA